MNSFLGGVIGSAVIALMYGWFIAQREDKIRGYLLEKSDGRARRRAVRAFVDAVRGGAVGHDTIAITGLFLFSVLFSASMTLIANGRNLGRQLIAAGSAPETLKAVVDGPLPKLSVTVVVLTYAGGIAIVGGYIYGVLVWIPFVWQRRMYAHLHERFMLRLQSLASGAELAKLARAEDRVVDESSLRDFVTTARRIAAEHEIVSLVDRFDPWAPESEDIQREELNGLADG